jgi:hypothetical protein
LNKKEDRVDDCDDRVVVNTRDVCGIQEHEFVQKVIEMYDKYLDCVKHAFQNDQCIYKGFTGSIFGNMH